MNECKFCNGEVIKPDSVGEGIPTVNMCIDRLCYAFGYGFMNKKEERCELGIQLQNGNRLCWDNSAREYAMLDVEIRYCPFCGKELTYKKTL